MWIRQTVLHSAARFAFCSPSAQLPLHLQTDCFVTREPDFAILCPSRSTVFFLSFVFFPFPCVVCPLAVLCLVAVWIVPCCIAGRAYFPSLARPLAAYPFVAFLKHTVGHSGLLHSSVPRDKSQPFLFSFHPLIPEHRLQIYLDCRPTQCRQGIHR